MNETIYDKNSHLIILNEITYNSIEIPVKGRTNPTKTLQDSVSLSVDIKDVPKLSDMIFSMCFLFSAIPPITDFLQVLELIFYSNKGEKYYQFFFNLLQLVILLDFSY